MVVLVVGLAGAAAWAFITRNDLLNTREELADARSQIASLAFEVDQTKCTLASTEATLTGTKNELEDTTNELKNTQAILLSTSEKLDSTNSELADTKIQLIDTKSELTTTKAELTRTAGELTDTEAEAASAQSALATAQSRLSSTEGELKTTKDRMATMEDTLEGLGITISSSFDCEDVKLTENSQAKNPTWQELNAFLKEDTTEQHEYIPGEYDCSQFSRDVHNDAEAAGIRSAVVHAWFIGDSAGHALNAFLTTDYGLVYVDCTETPDKIARVEAGKKLVAIEPNYVTQSDIRNNLFWDSLLWSVGHYYYVSDMPVLDIEIFW
jgi:predicted  nucleic acid-binding Zn-ribbon protein